MKRFKLVMGLVLLLCALLFPWLFPNPTVTAMAVFTLLLAMVATGWNLFSGFTGYVSLGHGAFFGIGAYALALLCQNWTIAGGYLPFVLLPLVGLIASACALPLGWIALRTRRQTFVVITIAIFFIMQLLAYNLRGLTNGSTGLSLPIPPWDGESYNTPFYSITLAALLLALFVCWWVRRSRYGLVLLALRDDEERVLGLGVQTASMKLSAFMLSAWFAGVGGGIYAYFVGSVFPPFAFDPVMNVAFTLAAFFGGVGTLWGPLLGAVMIGPIQQYLVLQYGANGLFQLIYGWLFLMVLLLMPQGIVPTLQRRWTRLLTRRKMKAGEETCIPVLYSEAVADTLLHEPLEEKGKHVQDQMQERG
jgi:branched-chain amino acid transport system permease protein